MYDGTSTLNWINVYFIKTENFKCFHGTVMNGQTLNASRLKSLKRIIVQEHRY